MKIWLAKYALVIISWMLTAVGFFYGQATVVYAQPRVTGLSDNRQDYPSGNIPRYGKLEINFDLDTVAQNKQLPFDATPPPGLKAGIGVNADAWFSLDNWQTVYKQPAFYYQEFLDEFKDNQEWFYPTGNYRWQVRFSPHQTGQWQYKIVVQDNSGITESQVRSFTVVSSPNKGFIRVSQRDRRYFEHDDGSYFPALGYNMNFNHLGWDNPVLDNADNLQQMANNGIQLIRIWLSQWGIFSTAWNPWNAINGTGTYYIPWSWTTRDQHYGDHDFSMEVIWQSEAENKGNPCMFLGWMKTSPAIKSQARYRVRVRYKSTGINGPLITGKPYGFTVKLGGWLWDDNERNRCYYPGTGSLIAASYSGSQWRTYPDTLDSSWSILEGNFYSENNNFLPFFYLSLENVTSGKTYIDYVWIEEDLGNGQYGPNILAKPLMDQHQYFDQRNSYAFDKLLALAESKGVYLRPVILEKNEWIMNHIDYNGQFINAGSNDYFYGNWRQLTKVRWLQQAWWRYLQARWGYSANIHSWELINEGDPYSGLHYTLADEFGKYMRQFKPNNHLVSTSNWHSFPKDNFWANNDYINVDFADVHHYLDGSDPNFYDAAAATYSESLAYGAKQDGGAGKPVIRGEIGFGDSDSPILTDSKGVWLHNFIWGGINPGGLIESYWYEAQHIYGSHFDHRGEFGNYYQFIKDIALSNGHYQDAQALVSHSDLRAWGQKDLVHGNAHLWIQNKRHTWKNVVDNLAISPIAGTVTINGFKSGQEYQLEWWNSYQGQVDRRERVIADSSGKISLSVNNLTTDSAVKILSQASSGCREDVDEDGAVSATDLLAVLRAWGNTAGGRADVSGNGSVEVGDILMILRAWGGC